MRRQLLHSTTNGYNHRHIIYAYGYNIQAEHIHKILSGDLAPNHPILGFTHLRILNLKIHFHKMSLQGLEKYNTRRV